jgi:hypothetical protein
MHYVLVTIIAALCSVVILLATLAPSTNLEIIVGTSCCERLVRVMIDAFFASVVSLVHIRGSCIGLRGVLCACDKPVNRGPDLL